MFIDRGIGKNLISKDIVLAKFFFITQVVQQSWDLKVKEKKQILSLVEDLGTRSPLRQNLLHRLAHSGRKSQSV